MVNLFHVNNRDDGFVDFVRARHRNPLRWFPYNNIKISSFKIFPLICTRYKNCTFRTYKFIRVQKFKCTFLAVGIWTCSKTGRKVAGGAWEPHTQNYVVVNMGLKRLREG